MEQQVVDFFNQATQFTIGCKERIKNLVANKSHAAIIFESEGVISMTFQTMRKGKPTQGVTYDINRKSLTEEQASQFAF